MQHIELDGRQVEAMPFSDGDWLIKGTKTDRLTFVSANLNVVGVDSQDPSDIGLHVTARSNQALATAFDHFWPGWRIRTWDRHKEPIIDRFEANVRRQWRPTDAHELDEERKERLQGTLDDIDYLAAGSIAAEILKKYIFQGKNYDDVDTGDLMNAEARKCQRAMARLDVENHHHVACFHALLGLLGEAYEVLVDWDRPERLKLELGDILFYVTTLAHLQGMTLEDLMDANVKKLTERFPNGWQPAAPHVQEKDG